MEESPGGSHSQEREQRVDEAIATSILAAVDAGGPPDPRTWLAKHPDLAPELEAFLADQDRFNSLVGAHGPGAGSHPMLVNAASPAATGTDAELATVDFTPEVINVIGAGFGSFGPYELLGKIGEGGQGVVFELHARTPSTGSSADSEA